jgi:hypothetical protein
MKIILGLKDCFMYRSREVFKSLPMTVTGNLFIDPLETATV